MNLPSDNRMLAGPPRQARAAIVARLAHARQREAIVDRFARVAGRELSAYVKASCLDQLHAADLDGTADDLLDSYRRQAAALEATSATTQR